SDRFFVPTGVRTNPLTLYLGSEHSNDEVQGMVVAKSDRSLRAHAVCMGPSRPYGVLPCRGEVSPKKGGRHSPSRESGSLRLPESGCVAWAAVHRTYECGSTCGFRYDETWSRSKP